MLVAQGISTRVARLQVGANRFRPIAMTTLAAILALLPLALGLGQGSAMQQPSPLFRGYSFKCRRFSLSSRYWRSGLSASVFRRFCKIDASIPVEAADPDYAGCHRYAELEWLFRGTLMLQETQLEKGIDKVFVWGAN